MVGFLMTNLSSGKGERAIALTLRYGSRISTLVMALGLGLLFTRGPAASGAGSPLLDPGAVLKGLIHFEAAALAEFGILLLLLTPILRIIAAMVSFAAERDARYVLISLGVLAIVLLSLIRFAT